MTSIQKLLGRKSLNTTMTYARLHDRTLAEDYYEAMNLVENRLALNGMATDNWFPVVLEHADQLLALVQRMGQQDLSAVARLRLADRVRDALLGPAARSFHSSGAASSLSGRTQRRGS